MQSPFATHRFQRIGQGFLWQGMGEYYSACKSWPSGKLLRRKLKMSTASCGGETQAKFNILP